MPKVSFKRLSESLEENALRAPDAPALFHAKQAWTYAELAESIARFASGLVELGARKHDRVAIFLPKQFEAVVAIFGASAAGCTFVPVNPVLKPRQVAYILRDCEVRVLVTDSRRLKAMVNAGEDVSSLTHVVLVDEVTHSADSGRYSILTWAELSSSSALIRHRVHDWDMTAILYTSGSTGHPKGVVLSHRNMVCGAMSVSSYLNNTAEDRLLSVLPLSFDYGLSQLTTAFHVGASCVLLDYLAPGDVLPVMADYQITGCAAVPSLWTRLASLEWPTAVVENLRYITNSGGAMPRSTTEALSSALPNTQIYLMYGLTEAFRSTFLEPSLVAAKSDSIGKAIPFADVIVAREDGTSCAPNEPGELVHRGPLVAMGYWNDTERTAERFRPAPGVPDGIVCKETAVWSGDRVRADDEGFLYFVSRNDEMIKTSGYRVSPTEVEEVIYSSGYVSEAVIIGVPHDSIGQAIVAVVVASDGNSDLDEKLLLKHCRKELPSYMVPLIFVRRSEMPRNPNGKLDRKQLAGEYSNLFEKFEAEAG